MVKDWYLISSNNYLSGYERVEIENNAVNLFNELLQNSPESFSITVNEQKEILAIIQMKSQSKNERYLLTNIGEVEIGDTIKHKNYYWLVTEFVEDNGMNDSTVIQLCNGMFPLTTNKKKILLTDENGNPVYDDLTGEPIYEIVDGETIYIPCIIENNYRVSSTEEQILLPKNELLITLPYREEIVLDYRFNLNDELYKVINIDRTKVFNNKGILTIRVEREVDSNGDV